MPSTTLKRTLVSMPSTVSCSERGVFSSSISMSFTEVNIIFSATPATLRCDSSATASRMLPSSPPTPVTAAPGAASSPPASSSHTSTCRRRPARRRLV